LVAVEALAGCPSQNLLAPYISSANAKVHRLNNHAWQAAPDSRGSRSRTTPDGDSITITRSSSSASGIPK